jgi:hypothetical protein
MNPSPAVIFIWDHEGEGATAHAAETLHDERLTDSQRGRYLLVIRDPNKRYDWSFHTQHALLEQLKYIFERNDCRHVSVQWHVAPMLAKKLRALHEQCVPEVTRIN